MLVSVAVLGWLAWKSIREHGARHEEAIALQKEAIALYRHSIESSQSSEQLQLESNALLRELIGELRKSRCNSGNVAAGSATRLSVIFRNDALSG